MPPKVFAPAVGANRTAQPKVAPLSFPNRPMTPGKDPLTRGRSAATKRPLSSPPFDTRSLRSDRLGTLVQELTALYSSSESWEDFVTGFRGPSYLSEELETLEHPASTLLAEWRDNGVPVKTTSAPWTLEQKDECVRRGCHPSAIEHGEFLREEMAEFVGNRFWAVLPYDTIRHLENLMFSPSAIKTERERKPRLLCDHSWPWPWGSINSTTIPHAPPEAMQFGGTLPRILYYARHANPKFGPVRGSKQDLKDGFYKLALNPSECLRLAALLPKFPDEPQLVAVPLACTMGWVESPPSFCVMSETVCDVTNRRIQADPLGGKPHRLSTLAEAMDDDFGFKGPAPREPDDHEANLALSKIPGVTPLAPEPEHQAPPSNRPLNRPVSYTDVFMDDYLQLAQGSRRRHLSVRNHLLHTVDSMIRQPVEPSGDVREPVSIKKVKKGDGSWNSRKVMLGWTIDFARQTLELPPHRKLALAEIFTGLANSKRISYKKWQSILGKLRFVAQAIPGSAGLFGALMVSLNKATQGRIRINASLRHHIDTFASLAASLCHRPTHLAEIVPEDPSFLGTVDAAKMGVGGPFYCDKGKPYVWRFAYPDSVQRLLVSADNPTGTITNSDLEHSGLICQTMMLSHYFDVRYATISTGCDNVPAVSRVNKGAIPHEGAAAHLCNVQCSHQRQHRYCHVAHYLEGPLNVIADDASRLQHLSNTDFLTHLDQAYPQPEPWTLLPVPSEISSKLISALLSKLPPMPSPQKHAKPTPPTSGSGSASAHPSDTSRPSLVSLAAKTSCATCSSSGTATAPTTLSALVQSRKHSRQWARGSPTWVSTIPENHSQTRPDSIPYYKLISKSCPTTTTQQTDPTQPTLQLSNIPKKSSTQTTTSKESSTPSPSTSSSLHSTGFYDPPNTLAAIPTSAPKPSSSVTFRLP